MIRYFKLPKLYLILNLIALRLTGDIVQLADFISDGLRQHSLFRLRIVCRAKGVADLFIG